MRRRLWIIFSIVFVVAVGTLFWPRGVNTVVRNAGSTTMRNVHVLVTGRAYMLGDIQPNEVRSVHVKPVGESGITITYTDANDAPQIVDLGCYLESGYSGSISVDVANGAVTRKAESIRVTPR